MRFEWDSGKARRNAAKHGIRFEQVTRVWSDPLRVTFPDRFENGELRWHAMGVIGPATLVLVVHVYPDASDAERVRIIGARRATPHERRRYEREGA